MIIQKSVVLRRTVRVFGEIVKRKVTLLMTSSQTVEMSHYITKTSLSQGYIPE